MSAKLEIGEQLGSMDGGDRINGFVFDEHASIAREIGRYPQSNTTSFQRTGIGYSA